MKLTIKYLAIALLAAAIAGCTKKEDRQIQKKIEEAANACKDTAKCTVNINEIAKFEWDNMFVFNHPETKGVIEAAIGTSFPGYVDGELPMIFLNKGEIVYFENNPDGLIKGTPGQVIFSYNVTLKYWVVTPAKAIFRVKVEKTKDKAFYELFPNL